MSSNRFKSLGEASGPSPASPAPVTTSNPASTTQAPRAAPRKRKGHRGGKKKRFRRKSFAVPDEDERDEEDRSENRLYDLPGANLSGDSLDSEALLDHRDHQPMRPRHSSTVGGPSPFQNPFASTSGSRLRSMQATVAEDEDAGSVVEDENAPLLSQPSPNRNSQFVLSSYGARETRRSRTQSRQGSSKSSRTRPATFSKDSYDVNHPPSIPGSPTFGPTDGADMSFGDVMIRDDLARRAGSPRPPPAKEEGLMPLQDPERVARPGFARVSSHDLPQDVCIGPGMSELGDEDLSPRDHEERRYRTRRRGGRWPDLSILEEWMHFEKEGRTDERRVKKITEPQLINGRLRPVRKGWYRTDEDTPFRFTYFNEEFHSTIHSQTISELVQPGGGFKELFNPEPRNLSDDEISVGDDADDDTEFFHHSNEGADGESKVSTRQTSLVEPPSERARSSAREGISAGHSAPPSGRATPSGVKSSGEADKITKQQAGAGEAERPVRYGDRPVWWFDVLCPTEAEMKVISKAFGIHPLTAEDIMLQEAREKVELFRHYYFVNYRTFDQDVNSENFLEPINMYVVVFREGVLSFHFSMTPHPANVRRRIRQLRDYLILSSDWISYAIIDDITDVFQPLIQNIEDEVDEIDEEILQLHSSAEKRLKDQKTPKPTRNDDATTVAESSGDMLRRVGDCRKRVMSLYRLLGNKADVIKGFAKRCNERWEVAPRSEIGLYLGDIQDHIVTMTSSLGHYEKILARAHGNYLAQINIRMNERQEVTADDLGKLTVLGTIVLPMNIITGLWGMNVWVPGQEHEKDMTWFVCITAGLVVFGLICYFVAKRVYRMV